MNIAAGQSTSRQVPVECRFDGCSAPINTKGLCQGHYKQLRLGKELMPLRGDLANFQLLPLTLDTARHALLTGSGGLQGKALQQFEIVRQLVGLRVGRLVVVALSPDRAKFPSSQKLVCQCDCGNEAAPTVRRLLEEHGTKSCGCLRGAPTRKSAITVDGNIARVELTGGYTAIIDSADVPLISRYKWHAKRNRHTSWYAGTNIYDVEAEHYRSAKMHHLLIKPEDGKEIDHVNGNGLDNRRCNLREATNFQNGANRRKQSTAATSKYKGVSFQKSNDKWIARIMVEKRSLYLGLYTTEDDAAQAYDNAARQYFNEYACVNHPTLGERSALTGLIELPAKVETIA